MTDQHTDEDREPAPAQKPEPVKDRPHVSTVTPEDYPLAEREEADTATVAGERMDRDQQPTTETRDPNVSTEHQQSGDARRPSDTLDKEQPDQETVPRKSSLTKNA